MFAERGKLPHGNMCDFLVQLLTDHAEFDSVMQKALFAIGALARSHPENNARLSHHEHLLETLDSVLAGYYEGSAVIYGALPAITGLAEGVEENQDALAALPHICSAIAKVLYNELETDLIAQYACAAIAALVQDHPKNQAKLSAACNFIADVFTAHKRNVTIATEAARAVSLLAHKSITNRNKLGANDCCASLMVPMNLFFAEHVNATWWKIDKTLMFWTVRAIGDLAANNPNNQTKLGYAGACEFLVNIMKQRKHVKAEYDQEAKLFAYVFWALGNLVQIGAKGAAVDQLFSTSKFFDTTSPTNANTSATTSSGLPASQSSGNLLATPTTPRHHSSTDLEALGHNNNTAANTTSNATTSNASTSAATPGRSLGNLGRQATMFVNNVAHTIGGNTSAKSTKNTSRFLQEDLGVVFALVMRRYADAPVTMLWACRALVNLCKSQTLKLALLDEAVLGIVQGVMEKYREQQPPQTELLEWATMAQDVLMLQEE